MKLVECLESVIKHLEKWNKIRNIFCVIFLIICLCNFLKMFETCYNMSVFSTPGPSYKLKVSSWVSEGSGVPEQVFPTHETSSRAATGHGDHPQPQC